MALVPIGDVIKVEIQTDEHGFGGETKSVDSGIVVAFADKFNFFGFHSFAFEDSFMSEKLGELYNYYKDKLLGKRVFWTALSERGMVLKEGDKTYALIKITDLIAVADPEDAVFNVYGAEGGSFSV